MAAPTSLLTLPTEILQDIVDHYFLLLSSAGHADPPGPDTQQEYQTRTQVDQSERHKHSPLSVLLACKRLHEITQRHLYTHLEFRSAARLKNFEKAYCHGGTSGRKRPPYAPRTITIAFHNDLETRLFERLQCILHLFSPPPSWSMQKEPFDYGADNIERDEGGRLVLDCLSLQCYSHAMDLNVRMIGLALGSINPREFIWTGPDPPHHLSTAIVFEATPYLFTALQTYTNLTSLKLTNIALLMPDNYWRSQFTGFEESKSLEHSNPSKWGRLPTTPSLKEIYIGQAVYVSAEIIAAALLSPLNSQLEEIRLVDAYKESIWGPRMRRSDIENAAISLVAGLPSQGVEGKDGFEAVKKAVRERVVCEAVLGRINGGETVDLPSILL
ncbi:hypothetical protein BKA70DRAFT_1301714 [Coprinopsis sp. MPI-PUGE-AT-0042]|nr:hypothetical protein BKA70DRAFT_1301714 [Coprinopsis sp. MPI-PUGE-AT-0042]